jgi:hypothetical protein
VRRGKANRSRTSSITFTYGEAMSWRASGIGIRAKLSTYGVESNRRNAMADTVARSERTVGATVWLHLLVFETKFMSSTITTIGFFSHLRLFIHRTVQSIERKIEGYCDVV